MSYIASFKLLPGRGHLGAVAVLRFSRHRSPRGETVRGRCQKPKYLVQGAYSVEGVKGLLREGGSKRRAAIQQAAESVDGRVEAAYFADSGKNDFFVILDMPDSVRAPAASLVVKASGAVSWSTDLLTPEELETTRKTVKYRPPGARSQGRYTDSSHKGNTKS